MSAFAVATNIQHCFFLNFFTRLLMLVKSVLIAVKPSASLVDDHFYFSNVSAGDGSFPVVCEITL